LSADQLCRISLPYQKLTKFPVWDAYRRERAQEEEARRIRAIRKRVTEEVVPAIALHRRGEEGMDIVRRLTRPDDPIRQLIVETFKEVGVPQKLVEESLRDWTLGVNVMNILRS